MYDILTCFSKCTISFRNSMIFCYELHLSSIYRALGVALCVLTFTSDADCIPDLNYVHLRQNSGRNTKFKCTVSLYFPCLLTRKSILRKNDRIFAKVPTPPNAAHQDAFAAPYVIKIRCILRKISNNTYFEPSAPPHFHSCCCCSVRLILKGKFWPFVINRGKC